MNDNKMNKIVYIGFFLLLVAVFSIFLSGCQTTPNPNNNTNINAVPSNNNVDLSATITGSQQLKKFNSTEDLQAFLASQQNTNTASGTLGGIAMRSDSAQVNGVAKESVSAPSAAGASATDYSHTNVQVAGVDEADFVKNDDRYIYMVKDKYFIIVDALDANNAKIISQTTLDYNNTNYGTGQELFIDKNKAVVFYQGYKESFYIAKYDARPYPTSRQVTYALVYDITDKKNPQLLEKYEVSGGYYQSRMIGDIVYFVTQDYANYEYIEPPVITYKDSEIRPDIYYFDNYEQNYMYNTVASLDLTTDNIVDSKTFLLGYSNTLMVSQDNIYIAYQQNNYYCWWGFRCNSNWENDQKEKFFAVVVPLLRSDVKQKILDIKDLNLNDDEQWARISSVLKSFYEEAAQDQSKYEDMFTKIDDALQEYDAKKALERSKTTIHKIGIKDGKITYQDKGEVTGSLLNQFSMDEYNGNLRVATTVNIWTGKSTQYNNVYVLNDNMKVVGTLTNIAENESIYSTRFVGNKLYMVTFRQIDPFFVIDLTNPTDPKMLGQLKIPGYSSYLQSYKENFIIGVGKDTAENQWGGTTTTGIKVSLYDVSDFNNPKEVDNYVIGQQGSDSAVLYDHKAFLLSETKNIMVLPVTEVTTKEKINDYSYNYNTWNGVYVFKVSENGFSVIGKVKHSSSTNSWFNWYNDATVSRSLYLDNTLYTISNKYIKANDLSNNLSDITTINLPTNDIGPYPVPIPMIDTVGVTASSGVAVK